MYHDLFYPRQSVLITASASEKVNVTTVEWIMPVGEKPPILAFSLRNSSLTLDLVCTSMEFVVAIPSDKIREAVKLCGTTSGKFLDKFSEGNLTQVKAKKVSAPLILEAAANIECKVLSYANEGDHTIVVGEVVETHMPKEEKFEPVVFTHEEKRAMLMKKN